MEEATYYATMAQLLPIVILSSVVELRWHVSGLHKWKTRSAADRYERVLRRMADVWMRIHALSVFTLLVTLGVIAQSLQAQQVPQWVDEVLTYLLPVSLGLLGAGLVPMVFGTPDRTE